MGKTQQDIRLGVRRTLKNGYHYGGSENMAKRKQKSSSGMNIPEYQVRGAGPMPLAKNTEILRKRGRQKGFGGIPGRKSKASECQKAK